MSEAKSLKDDDWDVVSTRRFCLGTMTFVGNTPESLLALLFFLHKHHMGPYVLDCFGFAFDQVRR